MFSALAVNQFDSDCPGKVRVSANHFNGKDDLVHDALAWRLLFHPQFQIFNSVIKAIAVFVVDVFAFTKRAPQCLFHKNAVLKIFFAAAKMQSSVSRRMNVPVFVNGAPIAPLQPALSRTVTLLHIVAGGATAFESAKASFYGFVTELTLKHRRGLAVHAALLTVALALVKEIV